MTAVTSHCHDGVMGSTAHVSAEPVTAFCIGLLYNQDNENGNDDDDE